MVEILGLIVGSGILAALWQWLRRPRLRVYCDPANTGERVPTDVVVRGFRIRQQAAWYHVHVTNEGHRIASECQGQIEQMEHFVDGQWLRYPEFRAPIPLPWANTDGDRVLDIHPGSTFRLDLGSCAEGKDVFCFHSGMRPSGLVQAVAAGRYRLLVTVLSGSPKPTSLNVILNFGGDWNSISIRMALRKQVKAPTEKVAKLTEGGG